jgi:hypothetical protein
MPSFVSCNFPTPGTANTDGGNIPPSIDFNGIDFDTIQPDTSLRFYAHAEDDVAIMGVEVVWRRLDVPDVDHRIVLMDDGMNGDGGMLDGIYSGLLPFGLPEGGSIQFYLECRDIDEQPTTTPSNPVFSGTGQTPNIYTLAIPASKPPLEISEVVANNKTGYSDGTGRPDWIEIRNTSDAPVSLAGIAVAQNLFGKSDRFSFSNPASLAPGQHVVISADANTNSGALHAPFKINKAGDRIVLTGVDANGARMLIDSLAFGPQVTDVALARLGAGGPWRKTTPTPGTGNVARTWDALVQTNGYITIGFPSASRSSYVVEYKDQLIGGPWTSMSPIRGDGIEKTITEAIESRRFYRVRQQQP